MSSIVLYGPGGTGKTTLAASLSKLGYIPLFYDVDKKIPGMVNLAHLLEENRIRVVTPESALSEGTLREKFVRKGKILSQPKGYYELMDWVNDLLEDPPEDVEIVVPVLDSLTRAIEHMKRAILQLTGKEKFEFAEWASILSNLEELFDSFFNQLAEVGYPHQVIICHSMIEKDEVTGKVKILPNIQGAFREKVTTYATEMYYTSVEIKGTQKTYLVQTAPVGLIDQARSSMDLPVWVEADFEVLFEGRKDLPNLKAKVQSAKKGGKK
jgi:hypothetical protein